MREEAEDEEVEPLRLPLRMERVEEPLRLPLLEKSEALSLLETALDRAASAERYACAVMAGRGGVGYLDDGEDGRAEPERVSMAEEEDLRERRKDIESHPNGGMSERSVEGSRWSKAPAVPAISCSIV